MLIDTHCHLDHRDLADDQGAALARARACGVARMVTISTHVSRFDRYSRLAEDHPDVFFTIGTHPHHASEEPDVPEGELVALARHPRCIGIGEAGLDYHYERSARNVQQRVFRTHIAAARATGLPLVIHARDADADMIAILDEEAGKGPFRAVLHCFSSGDALAEAGVAHGFYVSFSGMLTFKRSEALRRLAARLPEDRLLVETDSPYLAPEPHRGKRNEPAFVALTAAALAAVRGVSPTDMAETTGRNFYRLFAKAAAIDSPLAPLSRSTSAAGRA